MKIFLGSTALLSCEAVKATRVRAKTKKYRLNLNERKILAYRHFFSMSDEESYSESEFYLILFFFPALKRA